MFGFNRFVALLDKLEEISQRTGCRIRYLVTTNGALVTEKWASLFHSFDVSVTLSIDGPSDIHDAHRIDLKGQSYSCAMRTGFANFERTRGRTWHFGCL